MTMQAAKDVRRRGLGRLKRVFLIFLVSYLIMLFLPTAGILYLYNRMGQIAEQNCAQNTLTLADHTAADLRAEVSWMDSTAGSFLLDTTLTDMLFADPLRYGDQRVNQFNAFSQHLNDRIGFYDTSSQSFRLLFQDSELIFYEKAISRDLRFVFNNLLHYEGMAYEEWYAAVFSSDRKSYIPAHNIRMAENLVHAVTYNYPIIRRRSGQAHKAVLQFFIATDKIVPKNAHPLSSSYLFTGDGQVLASMGQAAELPPALPAATDSSGYLRHGGGLWAWTQVEPGLTLALRVPDAVAFQDVRVMRTPLMAVFLLCAVVEGILSWYLARRNARPIEHLASNMKQMVSAPAAVNELDYLFQGIIQLQQDKQSADEAVALSRHTGTAMLLHRLLNYSGEDADELIQTAAALGLDLRASGYCVAVAALPQHTRFRERPALPELPQGLRVVISEGQRDTLNILYLSDHDEDILTALQWHLRQLLPTLPDQTRIGIGRACSHLADIPFSFGQAMFCLQTEEHTGPVLQYDQVTPAMNSLHFPLEQQQRLLNAVRHGNPAVIDQEFDALLHENTVARHLPSLLKRTLLSSAEALLLMAAENTVQGENLADYLRSVHQSEDFRTELDVLRAEFKRLALLSGERYSQQASGQRDDMQRYLEEHYSDSMLSIGSMAEHFGFSESYFSVLFKELMGEPYSLCLEKLRLDKAGELLRTTDLSIEDVAQQAGYNNSTTFRRAFKRVKGISPLQFRNQ